MRLRHGTGRPFTVPVVNAERAEIHLRHFDTVGRRTQTAQEAFPVERQQLDPMPGPVVEERPLRHPDPGRIIAHEPVTQRLELGTGDRSVPFEVIEDEVKILVAAGPLADQGVDPPTSGDPEGEALVLEDLDDPKHLLPVRAPSEPSPDVLTGLGQPLWGRYPRQSAQGSLVRVAHQGKPPRCVEEPCGDLLPDTVHHAANGELQVAGHRHVSPPLDLWPRTEVEGSVTRDKIAGHTGRSSACGEPGTSDGGHCHRRPRPSIEGPRTPRTTLRTPVGSRAVPDPTTAGWLHWEHPQARLL